MKRDYYYWLVGTTADQFATSIRTLVLPIIIVAITGDVTAAGTLETATQIIFVVLALFGGVLVDRIDRRTGIYMRACIGFVVWLAATVLLATGYLTYPMLFVIALVAACGEAMFGFADDAALRSIVTDDAAFASAQSVIQARRSIINLLGGPVGGLLYASVHWLPFGVTAGALALLGTSALLITTDLSGDAAERDATQQEQHPQEQHSGNQMEDTQASDNHATDQHSIVRGMQSVCSDIAGGFRLVFFDAVKRPIAIVSAVMGFASTLIMTLVNYWLIQQHYTAFEISLVEVAAAVGMLIGSALSGKLTQNVPTGRLVIIALLIVAADFFGFAVVPYYWAAFIWLAIYGLCIPIISSPMLGYFYARTPQSMQGRSAAIMTVAGMGVGAFAPLVSSGLVAAGQQLLGFAAGGVLMALCAILFICSRKVRRIGLPESWAQEQ